MTDHDDALSDSGWIEADDALYDADGGLRTKEAWKIIDVDAQPERDAVRVSTYINSEGTYSALLSRPQVDELIRMLVSARAETWPAEGYDGEEEDDWESKEITL